MVKIGRKFFFNQTFQKRKRKNTLLAILFVVILIISTFLITSHFHNNLNNNDSKYKIKREVKVEVFNEISSYLIFFDEIQNVPLKNISISYDKSFTYEKDLNKCTSDQIDEINNSKDITSFACANLLPNKIGNYEVTITINNKKNKSRLIVVDNTPPVLEVKDVSISNEENYNAQSFVSSCIDNSKEECIIDFYTPLKGEKIDYSNIKSEGEHSVKIIAKDKSGNMSDAKEAKLTIKQVKYYTVSFNSNGGNNIESQTIREGKTAYSPYPTRGGYEFMGWYNGNSKFDFNTPINSNVNLTASWKAINNQSNNSSNSSNNNKNNTTTNTCSYGKYSDYYGSISIYAYLLNGKSINDCADKNNGADTNYTNLRNTVLQIANTMTKRNTGELDKDIRKEVGASANILFTTTTEHIVNSSDGFVGFNAIVEASINGQVIKTYTLYNCTISSCKWK